MDTTQEKKYQLRALVASDMGAICKIISAIGIRQFKDAFRIEDFKANKDNVEAIGFNVLMDGAGIIISNYPKAEKEIQFFVASLTGLQVAEIEQMPFADFGELIVGIVKKEDFRDFFMRVTKLFNQ